MEILDVERIIISIGLIIIIKCFFSVKIGFGVLNVNFCLIVKFIILSFLSIGVVAFTFNLNGSGVNLFGCNLRFSFIF